MCGFFGLQSFHFSKDQKILASKNAIKLLKTRGPDSDNFILEDGDNLTFSHNRLSILDLSQTGNQPMRSLSGNFVIIYNGEIYNHLEIREELEKNEKFSKWKGTSDTETLLQALEIWGIEKTLKRIKGMFSFAVWCRDTKKLYLARDRFGEKPLYYGWISQIKSFVFSSDLIFDKLFNNINFNINPHSVNDLLHLNYIDNNHTILKDIKKIEPGSFLEIFFKKNEIPSLIYKKYWDIREGKSKSKNFNDYENAKNFLDLKLTDAVKSQIYADVEVGTFLSGGIDSSLITAKAQELSTSKVKTFCIGNENQSYDESDYARKVSKSLGTDHEEIILNDKIMIDKVPSIINELNEPLGDSSFIPSYFVSKLAQKKVKVVLTGDAGDEMFGGYNRYTQIENLKKINLLPKFLKKIIKNNFNNLTNNSLNRITKIIRFLPKFKNQFYLNDKIKKVLDRINPDFNQDDFILSFLLNKITHNPFNNSIYFNEKKIFENLNYKINLDGLDNSYPQKIINLDLISYLPNDILFKVDRASMANSLETRAPFLDLDLFNFSQSIPMNYKIKKSEGKIILKDLLKEKIPDYLVDRPKAGFSIPVGGWIKKPLLDWSENLLNKKNLEKSGIFDYENIQKIWIDHKNGRDNTNLIWSILVFQQWLLNR